MVIGYGNIRAMDNESSVTARMLLVRHWCCWMNELTPSEVAKPSTLSNQTPLLKRGPFQNASIHQWTKDLMREKPLKHYSVRVEWWRRKLLVGKATTKRLLERLFFLYVCCIDDVHRQPPDPSSMNCAHCFCFKDSLLSRYFSAFFPLTLATTAP